MALLHEGKRRTKVDDFITKREQMLKVTLDIMRKEHLEEKEPNRLRNNERMEQEKIICRLYCSIDLKNFELQEKDRRNCERENKYIVMLDKSEEEKRALIKRLEELGKQLKEK